MERVGKELFVKKFGETLSLANIGVKSLEYLEEHKMQNNGVEYVTQNVIVHYVNGHTKRINVWGDSHYAIILDVMKHVMD